jgi:integrase
MASIFKRNGAGPWIISYFDHQGRRREKSSRTTDHKAAERIASKLEADAALRREGVIDSALDKFVEAGQRLLSDHVEDYLEHCKQSGQAKRHLICKRAHLAGLVGSRLVRLPDLSPQRLSVHLQALKTSGKAARTVNACRATVLAFMQWCWKQERVSENRLGIVPRFDERRDRRRERRALTLEEVARLLQTTRDRGDTTGDRWVSREAFYRVSLLTGLRRGELRGLTWADVRFEDGCVRVRAEVSKARREDFLPLHPDATQALRSVKPADAKPDDRVFPTLPTIRTLYQDFERAGIRKRDEHGRVVDLHSFRTTLATELARRGVGPQLAQRLLRHRDARTTLVHYTALGWKDAAPAVEAIPPLDRAREGKDRQGRSSATRRLMADRPQQIPQHSERDSVPDGASECDVDDADGARRDGPKFLPSANLCDKMPLAATSSEAPRGCSSAVERQLPKLNVVGSIPITRSILAARRSRRPFHVRRRQQPRSLVECAPNYTRWRRPSTAL